MASLASLCPSHIGVVVKDIDKTTEFLSSMWGLGPWQVQDTSPSKDEIIVGKPFTLKLAFAKLGPTKFELLEPVTSGSIWAEFLERNGEGIHHLAFDVANWDEMVSKLQEQGDKMVAGGIWEGHRWCYFDTKPGGIVVELMEK
jgi:catechol 2,3-dioxygenase-like lactoylglutathione lyase family enzyme